MGEKICIGMKARDSKHYIISACALHSVSLCLSAELLKSSNRVVAFCNGGYAPARPPARPQHRTHARTHRFVPTAPHPQHHTHGCAPTASTAPLRTTTPLRSAPRRAAPRTALHRSAHRTQASIRCGFVCTERRRLQLDGCCRAEPCLLHLSDANVSRVLRGSRVLRLM